MGQRLYNVPKNDLELCKEDIQFSDFFFFLHLEPDRKKITWFVGWRLTFEICPVVQTDFDPFWFYVVEPSKICGL